MTAVWTPLRGCVGRLLAEPVRWVLGDGGEPPRPNASADDGPARPAGTTGAAVDAPEGLLGVGDPLPPGPWRWRWQWAGAGRPAGMALLAADGSLLLWSPGGFAAPGAAADGRPTPEVARALARLPELAEAADDADRLAGELERARAVAAQTRLLLDRAAGIVDDEIGRVNGRP